MGLFSSVKKAAQSVTKTVNSAASTLSSNMTKAASQAGATISAAAASPLTQTLLATALQAGAGAMTGNPLAMAGGVPAAVAQAAVPVADGLAYGADVLQYLNMAAAAAQPVSSAGLMLPVQPAGTNVISPAQQSVMISPSAAAGQNPVAAFTDSLPAVSASGTKAGGFVLSAGNMMVPAAVIGGILLLLLVTKK
jgi:hypothetical protein